MQRLKSLQKSLIRMELSHKIGVVGLGYVGLPLAITFSKIRPVKGFDISIKRINELKKGYDINGEVSETEIKKSKNLTFISKLDNSTENCFIVTAPTPIDNQKKPDLFFLKKATEIISKILKKRDIIMLVHGAHGFKTLKPVQMIEIKQGPFISKLDKIKFNEVDEKKIKIKK